MAFSCFVYQSKPLVLDEEDSQIISPNTSYLIPRIGKPFERYNIMLVEEE